jgi:hypothetical protein
LGYRRLLHHQLRDPLTEMLVKYEHIAIGVRVIRLNGGASRSMPKI